MSGRPEHVEAGSTHYCSYCEISRLALALALTLASHLIYWIICCTTQDSVGRGNTLSGAIIGGIE
ncbi:hypothetical protein J6590_050160 [Homalodisca vitripennis]|nr:hypothetical protein J6590_050160 [Homalodisca vitripennis]